MVFANIYFPPGILAIGYLVSWCVMTPELRTQFFFSEESTFNQFSDKEDINGKADNQLGAFDESFKNIFFS